MLLFTFAVFVFLLVALAPALGKLVSILLIDLVTTFARAAGINTRQTRQDQNHDGLGHRLAGVDRVTNGHLVFGGGFVGGE